MQGRLSECVDGKIQAFPWRDWKQEFSIASSIDLRVMEWTLDQKSLYKNPLLTSDGQNTIMTLSKQFGVKIPSLTGDCFMQAPFWKASGITRNIYNLTFVICNACANVGISTLVIPLVDNGQLDTEQENILIDYLLSRSIFWLTIWQSGFRIRLFSLRARSFYFTLAS